MDAGFVTSKKRTTIIHVGSHFSLGSTVQPKLFVIMQLNFNRKIFIFSRILADFFSLRDHSANPKISRFFSPAIRIFFRLKIGGLYSVVCRSQLARNASIHVKSRPR